MRIPERTDLDRGARKKAWLGVYSNKFNFIVVKTFVKLK